MALLENLKQFQRASKTERDREFVAALKLLQGQTEVIQGLAKALGEIISSTDLIRVDLQEQARAALLAAKPWVSQERGFQ